MFLSTLTAVCGKTERQIHAYCLMRHHFHLVVETPQAKAKCWLREEMSRAGWDAEALRQAGKGDERKVRRAARVRRETTLPLKWIAGRVGLGTSKSANTKLDLWMQAAGGETPLMARAAMND
jgi:hypothetical protein